MAKQALVLQTAASIAIHYRFGIAASSLALALAFSLPVSFVGDLIGKFDTLLPGSLLHLFVMPRAIGLAFLLGFHGAYFLLMLEPLLLGHQI